MRIVFKSEDELRERELLRLIEDKQKMQAALEQAYELLKQERQATEDARRFNAQAVGRLSAVEDANKTLTVNLDWFRVRLTQVELERAKLLHLHTGVKIETPSFEVEKTPEEREQTVLPQMIAGFAGFEDIGDEEAAAQGLGWDEEGRVQELR